MGHRVGPIALFSFVIAGVSVANVWGWHLPAVQLFLTALAFGGVLAAMNSLIFLGELGYWRYGNWRPDPPAGMVAVGRAAEGIDHLSVYPEAFGFSLMAVAMVFLARAAASVAARPALGVLAYAEAAALAGVVICSIAGLDIGYDVFALLAGLLVGPILLFGLARMLRRRPADLETTPAAEGAATV